MTNNFFLHQSLLLEEVLADLQREFHIIQDKVFHGVRRQYDSFDWRLYRSDLELFSEHNKYILASRTDPGESWPLAATRRPVFINDISEDEVKRKLGPVLEMRALILIYSVKIDRIRLGIVDNNHKTIVRLDVEKTIHAGTVLPIMVKIIPLRGFSTAAAKLRTWLQGQGFTSGTSGLFETICDLSGVKPGGYSSKLDVQLERQTPVPEAIRKIHGALLHTLTLNKQGIIKDIDTEFLHDFRVAVRRTRSLYQPARSELEQDLFAAANEDFGYLGKLTNRLRDIDVYLLNREKYLRILPAPMRPELEVFFADLVKERRREHRKVVSALKSKKYHDLMIFWSKNLASSQDSDKVGSPVSEFARKTIQKRLEKVIRLGVKISDCTPNSLLHKLRIECKKFRYALEFYGSLFAPEMISTLIRHLKLLQDNLGDFNDLVVQQEELRDYVKRLREPARKDLVLAVGFLVATLNRRQKNKRAQFAQAYASFSGPDMQKIFSEMK